MRCFTILFLMLCLSVPLSGQNVRAAYSFYYKTDINQENYGVEPDMMLDWSPINSVFYSDASFHRDSLSCIAFDTNGNVCNNDAYQQIYDYRGGATKDVFFIDLSDGTYESTYRLATECVAGKGKLELPQWKLTDESTTTSTGFSVKKATASYLGRTWIVWYCEDVPISSGPWLLWGTPGLIVHAHDSDEIFHFKLLNIQQIESDSRYSQIRKFCDSDESRPVHKYSYDILKAEQVHNRMMRDLDYLFKMAGESSSQMTIVDRNGRTSMVSDTHDYIPLIPDNYWK